MVGCMYEWMTSCLASSVGCDLKEGTTYSFLFPKHLAQCLHIMSAKYFGEESQFSLIGQGGTFVITVSRIYSDRELLWGSISPRHIACPHGIHGLPGSLPHFIFIVRSYSIFILQFSGSQLGVTLASWGHVDMSGHIFGCPDYRGATRI